jgi:hypothetical protein
MSTSYVCGHEDEWNYFGATYRAVIPALTEAHDTFLSLLKSAKPETEHQRILCLLSQMCLKEFEEILLLAANGYGGGAIKLLRAFYERVVTLHYLATKPDKMQQFEDYTWVHWHKLLTEATSIQADMTVSEQMQQDIKERFEAVKASFMVDQCKPCNKKTLQGSWTKKPVGDQASAVSEPLRKLCFNAYLRPTFYLHTTYLGMTWLCDTSGEAIKIYGSKIEHATAREVLPLSHILLVHAADVANDFYQLGQNEQIKKIAKDWKDLWDLVPANQD